jgi:cytochrome P450
MLEERKKEKHPRSDLLQHLINAKDDDGNQLSDNAIVSEMLTQMYVLVILKSGAI